jgi:hypothetical protein
MSYIGRGTVVTAIDGTGQFDITIPFGNFLESDYFTATATRIDGGSTSDFARNRRLNETFLTDLRREAYGDRNEDGTDDVDQDNVSSFSAANGADTTVEVSAAASNSSELLLPKGGGIFMPLNDTNPTLENVSAETRASMDAPIDYSYSNGIITFEVPNLSPGASVSVKLILTDGATPDMLWFLQSDNTWTNTLPATFNDNQVTATLTDGGPGDRDGEANGRIVAALGPATTLPPIPYMNFTITKQANAHTLSWPSSYANALLEFSPDLSPDSWNTLDFLDPEPIDVRWQLTLPNPVLEFNDPSFYRLRYQE